MNNNNTIAIPTNRIKETVTVTAIASALTTAPTASSSSPSSPSSRSSQQQLRSSFIQNRGENNNRLLSARPPPPLLFSNNNNNNNRVKGKKSSSTSIMRFRLMFVLLALMAVGSSLYYNSNVSSQFQSTMLDYHTAATFGSTLFYNYQDGNISKMTTTLYSRKESTITAASTDSLLLSIPFQAEAKQLALDTDKDSTQSWTKKERLLMRDYLQAHIRKSLQEKVPTPQTALFWNEDFRNVINFFQQRNNAGVYDFYDLFPNHAEVVYDPRQLATAWGQRQQPGTAEGTQQHPNQHHKHQTPRLIYTNDLCNAWKLAKEYGNNFTTPHVLVTQLNENWGALSTEVPGRTGDWGHLIKAHWGEYECHWQVIRDEYLDSPNTLAVFTTQHQSLFNHPKVHSIPIGITSYQSLRVKQLFDDRNKHHKDIEQEHNQTMSTSTSTSTSTSESQRQRQRQRMLRDVTRKRLGKKVYRKIEKTANTDKDTDMDKNKGTDNSDSQWEPASEFERKQHQQQQQQRDDSQSHVHEYNQSQSQLQSQAQSRREQLLMINAAPSLERQAQIDAVIANFELLGHTPLLQNRYGTYEQESQQGTAKTRISNEEGYRHEILNSKFILCPSGIGWDTYRIWEALNLGTIPVIERYKYRYELITYPPPLPLEDTSSSSSTAKKNRKQKLPTLRPLFVEEEEDEKKRKKAVKKKLDHVKKYKARLEIVEYEDGWHKSLAGLPVVWFDGQFSDLMSSGTNSNHNDDINADNNTTTNSRSTKKEATSKSTSSYLTPHFLEEEYDNLARRAALDHFHYEKLTSTYWIDLMESFLLTPEERQQHAKSSWLAVPRDSQLRIRSPSGTSEEELQHPYHYDDTKNNGRNDNNQEEEGNNQNNENNHSLPPPPYPSMMIGWTILVWEIFISFKLAGIALIVIVVRRFEQQARIQAQNQNQDQQNHEQ